MKPSFIEPEVRAESIEDRAFAETRYSRYLFQRECILKNAPESSGIYGLFNAFWIYIGEADNLRAQLLEHLSGDHPSIVRFQPSGFAFELVSPVDRRRRYEQLIKRTSAAVQYVLYGESSLTPRRAPSSELSPLNHIARTDLLADLTWADLYLRQISKDLKQLTPAIRKVSSSTKLVGGTAKLRDQLEGAHRTIAELMTMAGSEQRRSNSK